MPSIPVETPAVSSKGRMSGHHRLLFLLTGWLIVLMPFLFWWNTWFGRQLSDKQLEQYLHDEKKPRHIQHALVQVGERMAKRDAGVTRWYPDLLRLASHKVEEVRNTDAWVMGQDTSVPDFHQTLLKMLDDSSRTVRGNAALSLVRFGDATGRPHIVALLQPAKVTAPAAGKITDVSTIGTAIHPGGVVAKLQTGGEALEMRSPIGGRVRTLVGVGTTLVAGDDIATISPETEQVWEAVRALYLIGQPGDLPAIAPYLREVAEVPDHIRKQAIETEKAIRERADKGSANVP